MKKNLIFQQKKTHQNQIQKEKETEREEEKMIDFFLHFLLSWFIKTLRYSFFSRFFSGFPVHYNSNNN